MYTGSWVSTWADGVRHLGSEWCTGEDAAGPAGDKQEEGLWGEKQNGGSSRVGVRGTAASVSILPVCSLRPDVLSPRAASASLQVLTCPNASFTDLAEIVSRIEPAKVTAVDGELGVQKVDLCNKGRDRLLWTLTLALEVAGT